MDSKRLTIRIVFWSIPLILLLVFWAVLKHGFTIDRIDIAGFHAEKLYLKLDKKIVLKAKELRLPRRRERARNIRSEELHRSLELLHRTLRFVQSVEIGLLEFSGVPSHLIYRDRILYLYTPELELAGMVYDRGREMEIQFPLLRIPRYDVTLSGELHYRYRDGRIEASGYYQIPDINGAFEIRREGERIRFRVDSTSTRSLHRLMELLSMSRAAKEWLTRRIHASRYRLVYLEGEGRYDAEHGRFVPDFATFRGAVALTRPRILFHDKLLPLKAEAARVVLQQGNLYFLLRNPRYGNRSLAGSNAALLHLNDPKRLTLLLRLHYQGRLDWQVLRILQAYGLPITLGQKSGKVHARVSIDIPLSKGVPKIQGIARFGKGALEFKKHLIPIGGGTVAFTSHELALRDLKILEPMVRGALSGQVDLRGHRARLKLDVDRIRLGRSKEPVVLIRKTMLPIEATWDQQGVLLVFSSLKSRLRVEKNGSFRLDVKRLAAWKPWLQGLYGIASDGTVQIRGDREGNYRITGTLIWPDSPFYTREGPVIRFPFSIRTVGSALRFQALAGRILFRSGEHLLRIEKLNVDARRLMTLLKRYGFGSGNGKRKRMGGRFTVLGVDSIIRYGPYVLLSDTYRLVSDSGGIRFEGVLGSDRVRLERRGDMLKVEAKRIGDKMLHALIHFNGLQGGHYTFHLEGTASKGYTGEILIDGGVLRDVKAYNDMIALFNTIPALVTFSNPGFSAKGFEIRKGRILFTLKGEKLHLGSILLEGKSSTIAGKGSVDLADKTLDIDLAIRTAREVGHTLGQIPVVGYILFGKDKSLTAGVKIRGTLDHPKVSTNPVGEALLYPLELLKRTLLAPTQLGVRADDELPALPTGPAEEKSPGKQPEAGGSADTY